MRLLGVVLGSVTFAVPVTATLIDLFGYIAKVEGVSMQPVLNPKGDGRTAVDYVFLNRWAVRAYQFQRGEIVSMTVFIPMHEEAISQMDFLTKEICESPFNPDQKIIKRIVALEGDTVRTLAYKDSIVHVPTGHCWVEGDHHKHSMDSNFFGPVSLAMISAKASHIVWPPERWQKLEVQPKDDHRFSALDNFLDT